MSSTYIFLALVTSGVVTFAIRLFPFLVLRNETNLSNRMQFISAVLPQANSRNHCSCNRSVVAMVEGEYTAQHLCSNGHLYGLITSDVKLTYMLI